jgi:hypothetical protein
MTNDFSNISAESEFRNEMTVEPNEGFDSHLEMAYEDRTHVEDTEETVETGWPGDGGGSDDLADFNANEVSDYQNE